MKGKIFNAQEVQALIAGNKKQFREVIKPQPLPFLNDNDYLEFLCPYQVGQKIFCKESFHEAFGRLNYKQEWEVDGYDKERAKFLGMEWKPAQHMKQEQSRLTLLIKEIRAERLWDISEEDCWKEGLEEFADYQDQVKICEMAKRLGECIEDPKPTFAVWWNATHKKPEEQFEANPWVWVLKFELVKNNL